MSSNPSALVIGVAHPDARGAENDALEVASDLLCNGWTVTLLSGDDATLERVFSLKATVCWFSGECGKTERLQLADTTIGPRFLALGRALTVFDCCRVGGMLKPGCGRSNVMCATSMLNWNESDGSSIFSHALRAQLATSCSLFSKSAPYYSVETLRCIATWMSIWCDRNNPTHRQAPIIGKL